MKFIIQKTERWLHINDYEGQVYGLIEDQQLCAHLLVNEPEDWLKCTVNTIINVDFWLERTGKIEKSPPDTPPCLRQLKESSYSVTGVVSEIIDEEEIILNSLFPIRVDLDFTAHTTAQMAEFNVGDCLQVIGQIKIDFE